MSRNKTAAKVALNKAAHPEQYCPKHRCLWHTGGGYCPRHAPIKPAAPYVAQARRIATMYNALAEQERRLEESCD
jgi:hypothetical protein